MLSATSSIGLAPLPLVKWAQWAGSFESEEAAAAPTAAAASASPAELVEQPLVFRHEPQGRLEREHRKLSLESLAHQVKERQKYESVEKLEWEGPQQWQVAVEDGPPEWQLLLEL